MGVVLWGRGSGRGHGGRVQTIPGGGARSGGEDMFFYFKLPAQTGRIHSASFVPWRDHMKPEDEARGLALMYSPAGLHAKSSRHCALDKTL